MRSEPAKERCGDLLQRRFAEIDQMLNEKVSHLENLRDMSSALKSQTQDSVELTLPQEVKLEYLLQQLACTVSCPSWQQCVPLTPWAVVATVVASYVARKHC